MSLAELLASVAVSGLLLGGTFLLLQQGQQAYSIGAARVEAQQSVRLAVERMAGEIRGAGFAPAGVTFAAIAVAEPTRLTIQHDLNGDGVIAGNGERITYLLRGTTLRRDAGGGAQPLVDGVHHLRFTYLDAERQPTTIPDAVRTVVISISAGSNRAWSQATPVVSAVSTEARLRNR